MKTRTLPVLAIGIVLASPAAAQQARPSCVAYDGFSMTSGPLIYADKQGIFRKFGLDISPIFIDGGSMLTQAVVGGSVDIAQNGYTPALSAAVQGADIVIIGGSPTSCRFSSWSRPRSRVPTSSRARASPSAATARQPTRPQTSRWRTSSSRATTSRSCSSAAPPRIAAAMSGQIAGTMEQYPDTAELSRHGFRAGRRHRHRW